MSLDLAGLAFTAARWRPTTPGDPTAMTAKLAGTSKPTAAFLLDVAAKRARPRAAFYRYLRTYGGLHKAGMRFLTEKRLGPYILMRSKEGAKVIDTRSGTVVHVIPYTSTVTKILRSVIRMGTTIMAGYGFGYAASTYTREAAWNALQGAYWKATAHTAAAILAPAVPGYVIAEHSKFLGSLYGLGGWVGSKASHAKWLARTLDPRTYLPISAQRGEAYMNMLSPIGGTPGMSMYTSPAHRAAVENARARGAAKRAALWRKIGTFLGF